LPRIATICARAGSKGVPGKNVRTLAGKPLIAHTISQARECGLFDAVAVSSDDGEILKLARDWGASHTVHRPPELAGDHAAKIPAIRHCVREVENQTGLAFDVVADLAVTSPLRSADDIRSAVDLLEKSDAGVVLSAMDAPDSPYFNIVEVDDAGNLGLSKTPPKTVSARQAAPQCYALNGAVYVWSRAALFAASDDVVRPDARLYVMPQERSLDIDSEFDFEIADCLLAARN